MQPTQRLKVEGRMPPAYSNIKSSADASKNPISKSSSRPSSGVGMLLLDAIGNDVKMHSVKDHKSLQSSKLNPVDIIQALNPSFRPPSAPVAAALFSLGSTADAPSKRSKSASALPLLSHKSRPSSRTSIHSSSSAFIDDDSTGEGLSIYGYMGTATATPRSELAFPSRATSAASGTRSKSSATNAHFSRFHTNRVVDLGDMVDDAAIDSFLLDFKRKSRMPFAAAIIQSFWRMARQRRAFNRYQSGKKTRGLGFKHLIFKAWRSVAVAQNLCRAFGLNVCFRHWIKVVMDSRGWINFCSEACNILSQKPTGLPGPILWNLCIRPSTWVAAQDEERALGDPLPVRALVVALQTLQTYCSKCINKGFRRWMKAFKWGVEQRAKGRLRLGHLLRSRFKEKFRLKFQMWARWAFFSRARRLHTPLPVFLDHLPFWNSWVEMRKRKFMYAFPFEKTFWFRWMFLKFKTVCQAKVSKSSKLSLVDQVFCISRMKNALGAWTKGMIVIRSETAFLLSRWRLFCLAIRIRKARHKMKRDVLAANCAALTKRAFTKWANDVKNALSYVLTAHNTHQMSGALTTLSRAFYIWTGQRAHAILVSVFMKWNQRARQRITWAIFLRFHAALSQRKLMRSVFSAWRQPAQAFFIPITDAEVVAMYILSHRHDSHRTNVTFGNQAFKAVSQQIADARNYTFVRASEMMQACPFESADKLCIQLTSTLWLQQIKSIISVKPSGNVGRTHSSSVAYRNLNDVFNACRDLLDPSFVDGVFEKPRQTFSKAQDVSECNWGECSLSAATRMSDYRLNSSSLVWTDLVYLVSVISNSCAHENSLRQHFTKAEMASAVKDASEKPGSQSKHRRDDFVSRCLQLTGLRMWLSSVVGGWNSMASLVPLIRNVAAMWDLRLKERRALVLRDNLIIISGKVRDESSIFAALFKTKKVRRTSKKKKHAKKKTGSAKGAKGGASSPDSVSCDESFVTAGSPGPKSTSFPPVVLTDCIIKPPEESMTMIQRLTNMVHASNDAVSSFALSETVSEAMRPDMATFDQQLHNRYAAIANDFAVSTAFQQDYNSDSDEVLPELNGIDSDDEETSTKTHHVQVQPKAAPTFDIVEEDAHAQNTAVTVDASSSLGPDFHISLAMKQYIAPKPVRIPRVAMPVSLLALARDLASQLDSNYESAKADLQSQILEVVAHKKVDPKSDDSSDIDEHPEESDDKLCSSPTVFSAINQESKPQFISQSADQMVVNSDLSDVTVKSPFKVAPNALFDLEGDLDITKDEMKFLSLTCPSTPGVSASFSALEAKFVLPFSPPAKGTPFQHWDSHDEINVPKSNEGTPVLLAIPNANASKRPKSQNLKKEIVVFSPPVVSSSSHFDAVASSSAIARVVPDAPQDLDFSLPEVPDTVKVRPSHSNAVGAFPSVTTPSKQNRCNSNPDRLTELLNSVHPPAVKAHQPLPESHAFVSAESVQKDENIEIRRQYAELGQKNAQRLKKVHSENSNAAKALTQAEEASNRRMQLLHHATESAYDALEIMAPHLKAIFEENFDALINRFIDAKAKSCAADDHHHWHELNLQRNAELRDASLGGLVADSDDHIKRVFQSRQHYRAMMAKLERSEGSTAIEHDLDDAWAPKSKPSVELDRQLYSSVKAPQSIPTTFTSGDREFITGFAKPISVAAAKAPFPHPSPTCLFGESLNHFAQMQGSRSFNRLPAGQGTTAPFFSTPATHPQSTPRDDSLVQAPQFVVVDSTKLSAVPQLCIAGAEISEPSFGSAEAAFLKAKNTRSSTSKPAMAGVFNPAYKTNSNPALKATAHVAGLPIVGGTSLGITVSKKLPLPNLESSVSSTGESAPDKTVSCNTTVSEKAAICNVQGLVQAKSIFKAPLLQTASAKTYRVPSAVSSRTLPTAPNSQAMLSLDSKVPFVLDAGVPEPHNTVSAQPLSSSRILGLLDVTQTTVDDIDHDADSEVEHLMLAAPHEVLATRLSPSVSPFRSPSPVKAVSFSAFQAVADFNKFLASLSIDHVLTKPQVSSSTAKVAQNRQHPLSIAPVSAHHVERSEQDLAPHAALPVRSGQSNILDSTQSSSGIADEAIGRRPEAKSLPLTASHDSTSSAARHIHNAAETATAVPARSVSQETASAPRRLPVHVSVPCVVESLTVPAASVTSDSHRAEQDVMLPLAALPISALFEPNSSSTGAITHQEVPPAASHDAKEPYAIVESSADTVFDVHASGALLQSSNSIDSEAPYVSVSTIIDSVSTDIDASAVASQTLIQSVLQAPHTTPHTSQNNFTTPHTSQNNFTTPHTSQQNLPSQSVRLPPPKIVQKPGVQGSAIRSVLLNIQGKAASNSDHEASSPAEIFHQQRASAVELIRQRSMLNPELRQRRSTDVAAGVSTSHEASSEPRRQSTLDHVGQDDDDDGDEGRTTGRIFKNQKIKILQAHMSSLSREFNALRSMYPPDQEIGERGDIVAGVNHFHDASSRITDRSADNSSITNRLSAFISELGRKSPARDAAFSFDFNKETNRELTAKVATSARVAPPVRPARDYSKVLGDSGSVASALEAHHIDTAELRGDGTAPKKKEEVTMRMAKARQVDPSLAAAATSDAAANKSIAADAAKSHAT